MMLALRGCVVSLLVSEITGFAGRTAADSTQIRKHVQHINDDFKVAAYTANVLL